MTMRPTRDGFAFPMVILVIGVMTAGLMTAFARSGAEVQIVENQEVQTRVFAIAQAGLEQYMSGGRVDPADTTFTYPGGTARVTATLMKPAPSAADSAIYLIQSVGSLTTGGNRPEARRAVAQVAYRVRGTMQVLSSWTSLSGLHKSGAAGAIAGSDACSGSVLPGIALPDGTFGGNADAISGDPPIQQMGTQAQMAAEIKIDWPGITNPSSPSIMPDIIVCKPGTKNYDPNWGPCGTWPPESAFTENYWPVIVINGTSSLPSNGHGTLIVTGDLTFGGGDMWDGIIMVGGRIVDNGSGNIAGAVVSGLNVLKGQTVLESSKGNGTKDYKYDSCKVQKAADSQGRLLQITNAWIDNWLAW